MATSYVRIIEDLAKSENIELKWEEFFPNPSIRKDAADKIKQFMIKNFTSRLIDKLVFGIDVKDMRHYVDIRKYAKSITLEQCKKLYSFFFEPKKVIETYSYQ
jgi:hypothetical protein